jgi:hypothetical protein
MSKYLNPQLTGKKRHRIATIGFLKRKHVLVLQYEVEGFVPEFHGGRVEGSMRTWWVDAKPEWELSYDKKLG